MREGYVLNIDRTVSELMQYLDPVKGEIGIEIEVEGDNLIQRLQKFWKVDRDGSLRGNEAAEYVLKIPLKRDKYKEAIEYLASAMKKRGAVIENTGRAGVHVHLNFQDVELRKVANMVCLYLMYEDALTDYCGQGRTGNLFCLGSRYAENVIDVFKTFIQHGFKQELHTDELRYASINLKALTTYGSIEFRSMRSTLDVAALDTWVQLLLSLKDAALKFKDPTSILNQFSQIGSGRMTKHIFGKNAQMMAHNHIDPELVQEAMWRIQPIVFCRDWEKTPKEYTNNLQYQHEHDGLVEKGNKNLFKEGNEVRLRRPRNRGFQDAAPAPDFDAAMNAIAERDVQRIRERVRLEDIIDEQERQNHPQPMPPGVAAHVEDIDDLMGDGNEEPN